MNSSINNSNNNLTDEDDYGFFYEFDQNIPYDNIVVHTNNRNYKIDKNILKKLNDKYKYTISPILTTLPMLTTIPRYYNFNLYKPKSPKSSKVMPILDENYIIEKNNLQYNTKENTTALKHKLFIHSVLILSFFVSILLIFL